MSKKYIVDLTELERLECQRIIQTLSGNSQQVKRAYILLQSDVNGAGWTDKQIASAYHCRIKTVENVRQRFVESGFRKCLDGKKREHPPVEKLLTGEQEARLIATRLSPAPKGYSTWSLRLLAERVVELGICETISHETVRQTLKKIR